MKKKIQDWLKNPKDYKEGLKLYNAVKTNTSKDEFFSIAPDAKPAPLQKNILIKTLSTIARKMPHGTPGKPSATAKIVAAEKALFFEGATIDVDKLPEEARAAYKENKKLTVTLAGLHQELRAALTDSDRKEFAAKISEVAAKREENWQLINNHLHPESKKKTSPATNVDTNEPESTESPEESISPTKEQIINATKRLKIVADNINRAQKELSTPGKLSDRQRTNREISIAKWKKEKEDIEIILKDVSTN